MSSFESVGSEKDKRKQILDAAVAVFSQWGFHEARVEEIAIRAGVGKGTVYEYFSSKLQLFQEMIRTGLDFYSENLYSTLDETSHLRERIKQIFLLHLQFTHKYRDLAKIIFGDHTSINDEMRRWLISLREKKISRLTQTLIEARRLGQIRAIDPHLTAQILVGITGALCYPIVFQEEVLDIEDLANKATDLIFEGIGR